MKSKEDKYGYVHREQYKQALDRIELLESRVRELYAKVSVLLTIFNKVDAVGKELDSPTVRLRDLKHRAY